MLGITRRTGSVLVGILCLGLVPIAIGQQAEQNGDQGSRRRGPRGGRQDNQQTAQQGEQQDGQRGGRRGSRREGQQGFQEGGPRDRQSGPRQEGEQGPGRPDRRGPRTFTPEDRERFYNEMVNRYMERLSDTYELSDDQQTQVRSRLEELRSQQRTYSEQHQKEFDDIRTQMEQLRESGAGFGSPQARELFQKMETLREQSPLMNRDTVTAEVEKLLPPEQVEKGRARREAERQEWDRRREEMRRRWEERRQQEGDQSQSDDDGPMRFFRDRGDRRRRDRGEEGQGQPVEGQENQEQQGPEGQDQQQGQWPQIDGRPVVQWPVEDPLGPWDRYVRDFARRYRLDESQRATAQSILREMHERRQVYEQAHRQDYEAAHSLQGQEREKRLAQLNQPIEFLFSQLKSRLERIPTTEQRRAAGELRTTSRPATPPSSAPAGATSQPAGG
ncbi:MAG TPA: hypothetical protein PLL20_04285 [Phycisphaerae bacterium]|nr:hypothetical protein [Phycisphaerae bacterium]HRR85944.1 hypothetical protein [Phycisphaerae bacterium]